MKSSYYNWYLSLKIPLIYKVSTLPPTPPFMSWEFYSWRSQVCPVTGLSSWECCWCDPVPSVSTCPCPLGCLWLVFESRKLIRLHWFCFGLSCQDSQRWSCTLLSLPVSLSYIPYNHHTIAVQSFGIFRNLKNDMGHACFSKEKHYINAARKDSVYIPN